MRRSISTMPVPHLDARRAQSHFNQHLVHSLGDACALFISAQKSSEMAASLMRMSKAAKAEKHARASLSASRRTLDGAGSALASSALDTLVDSLIAQDKFDQMEPYARELYDRSALMLGHTHTATLEAAKKLASSFVAQNSFTEAEMFLQKVSAKCRDVHGSAHQETRMAELLLSVVCAAGRHQKNPRSTLLAEITTAFDRATDFVSRHYHVEGREEAQLQSGSTALIRAVSAHLHVVESSSGDGADSIRSNANGAGVVLTRYVP